MVFVRVCMRVFVVACALMLAGCSLVDGALAPRAYDINQNTQNVRESGILLNIVRASRSEPLNFVALSRYTGTGSLAANKTVTLTDLFTFGAPANLVTRGSVTGGINANAGNTFDVGTLENRDFYGGFLSPLDLEGLNLLLNAGLSRELVFHSVMRGFRVTHENGSVYLYENNPEDDRWRGDGIRGRSTHCASLRDGKETAFEPVFQTEIWQPPHEADCRYQKFLYFLRLAVRYGITVEAIPLPQRSISEGGAKGKSGGSGGGDRDRSSAPSAVYFVCYDPAIARENDLPLPRNQEVACGTRKRPSIGRTHDFEFRFTFRRPIAGITPVVRSPYAVFQYYGHLLASGAKSYVHLSRLSRRDGLERENALLTIERGGTDCFASAAYGGESYCVPNAGTRNTKEVFVLLNTLVAISTTRSSLPASSTFVLTP
jgi:hypothetical protein